jgi:hypothetical protein
LSYEKTRKDKMTKKNNYRNSSEPLEVWLGILLILIGLTELGHISLSWLVNGVASFWTICNLTGEACNYTSGFTTNFVGLDKIINWVANIINWVVNTSVGFLALIGFFAVICFGRDNDTV